MQISVFIGVFRGNGRVRNLSMIEIIPQKNLSIHGTNNIRKYVKKKYSSYQCGINNRC